MSEHAIQPQVVSRTTPFHLAVIMDGNGRWARKRGLPRIAGHRTGAKAVRRCVEAAPEHGVDILTLYAFSADNWSRPAREVRQLMKLLQQYLQDETENCVEKGIRINVIGRRDRLDPKIVEGIERTEALTAGCDKLQVRIAIDYSARWAIEAASRLAAQSPVPVGAADDDHRAFGRLINRAMHADPDCPPVDLLLRTSGEKRLSDFLLWECAYAELEFIDTLWPDFNGDHLGAAVSEFRRRERRYGGVVEAR